MPTIMHSKLRCYARNATGVLLSTVTFGHKSLKPYNAKSKKIRTHRRIVPE